MPSYSRNEVILIQFPFSDLTKGKIRPAIVVNASHSSQDLLVVALTSKTSNLRSGEFVLSDWSSAGLNIESSVKRSVFTIQEKLVLRSLGTLSKNDVSELDQSLKFWLGLK